MLLKIKERVESELHNFIHWIDKLYSLSKISPVLLNHIRYFISRKGKRVRPILFVIGYLGYAKKVAPGLYRSALSWELLHDFMLVHDDIIDKSGIRRGNPSMHVMLNNYLGPKKNLKFNGQDLAIVIGDVMYAMALLAFLSVKEKSQRKEAAFKKLIEAVLYTGSGEFLELIYGGRDIDKITKEDIYKIYDLKTAKYTFAYPLTMGAILAGARKSEINKLLNYGIYLGRAFQIKDDILGIFGAKGKIGKSNMTDLQEAKKTILVWYAYRNTDRRNKLAIKRILLKKKVEKADLLKMRRIISASGALDFAKREVAVLLNKAQLLSICLRINSRYRNLLDNYSKKILSVKED